MTESKSTSKATTRKTTTRKTTNAAKKEASPKEETPVEEVVAEVEKAEEPVSSEPDVEDVKVEEEGTPYVDLDPNRYPDFFRPSGSVDTTGTPQQVFDSMRSVYGIFQREDENSVGEPVERRHVYRKGK